MKTWTMLKEHVDGNRRVQLFKHGKGWSVVVRVVGDEGLTVLDFDVESDAEFHYDVEIRDGEYYHCDPKFTDFCPNGNFRCRTVEGIYSSAAGYYIGTYCGCGPLSRESSGYYPSKAAAEAARKELYNE